MRRIARCASCNGDDRPVGPSFGGQAIGQDKYRRSITIESPGSVNALILHRQELVAAAGDDEDRRAVGAGRPEDIHFREPQSP